MSYKDHYRDSRKTPVEIPSLISDEASARFVFGRGGGGVEAFGVHDFF